jgi:hypothetical protein
MFQPDTLVLAQYLETVGSSTHPEGEKRLLMAVLEDAISCYQNYISTSDRREVNLFCEAAEWIFSQNDDEWLFSFKSVCEALGIDPGYIREGLLRWRHHRIDKVNGNRFASRN